MFTAPTEIYTLSLHDALPISSQSIRAQASVKSPDDLKKLIVVGPGTTGVGTGATTTAVQAAASGRSEEHTSELQSLRHLVCRLLLEQKNTAKTDQRHTCLTNG